MGPYPKSARKVCPVSCADAVLSPGPSGEMGNVPDQAGTAAE